MYGRNQRRDGTVIQQPQNDIKLNLRQKEVWKIAKTEGFVQVDRLAERLNVTAQTIRRDLNQLTNANLLQRIYGGAISLDSVVNIGYSTRKTMAAEGKSRISVKAAELIPNDCSLFINIGTTTEQVSTQLAQTKEGLLVVTDNINVVNILLHNDQFEIYIAGGQIRNQDGGILGAATSEFVSRFRVDYAIISASSIETNGMIADYDWREVMVTQTMIRHARTVILVADRNKFSRKAPIFLCELDKIDHLITDAPVPDEFMKRAIENDVTVHVCE